MLRTRIAKPFLKWAGGKTQLIEDIKQTLPENLHQQRFVYVEPFVGSGAVLFWMLNNFPNIKHAVINDVNADLVNTYRVIAESPFALISTLQTLEGEFHALDGDQEKKKGYYYEKRATYNTRREEKVFQAALFIFLNRTCFNGLYRVNRKNENNVPMGSYKKPTICDKENILAVNEVLKKVEILCGDFEQTIAYASPDALFYFDPPYKPLNATSSFNSYAKDEFDDSEQIRLKTFCSKLNALGCTWILSNSDVKGADEEGSFFDDLYADFQIRRVEARRSINANPEKRGALMEILVTNQVTSAQHSLF